jgi:integrase/recombinase XerD
MNRAQELKYKFMRELKLRNYADSSMKTYADCIMQYFRYMNGKKPADHAAHIELIKDYLLTISNQNYHKQMLAAIRNFHDFVLKQPLSLNDIPYPRKTDYLPEILNLQETNRLLNSYSNIKHKAIITLMYVCGLRIGEIPKIKIQHIDSVRGLVRISGAKGFKDRDVPVPAETIELLRTYFKQFQPKQWLFEGQQPGEQYTVRSIQQLFYQGCRRIGLRKKVRPHGLRHSRATHLKEAGIDIKDIADFLGHYNIKTTELYLKLSKKTLVNRIAIADELLKQIFKQEAKELAY